MSDRKRLIRKIFELEEDRDGLIETLRAIREDIDFALSDYEEEEDDDDSGEDDDEPRETADEIRKREIAAAEAKVAEIKNQLYLAEIEVVRAQGDQPLTPRVEAPPSPDVDPGATIAGKGREG